LNGGIGIIHGNFPSIQVIIFAIFHIIIPIFIGTSCRSVESETIQARIHLQFAMHSWNRHNLGLDRN